MQLIVVTYVVIMVIIITLQQEIVQLVAPIANNAIHQQFVLNVLQDLYQTVFANDDDFYFFKNK